MRRVVHVLDPDDGRRGAAARGAPPIACMACAEAIAATPECEHAVVCLDTGGGRVEFTGSTRTTTVAAPLGRPWLAWRAMRRVLRSLGGYEVLQPWSNAARSACRAAGARPAGPPVRAMPSIGAGTGRTRESIRAEAGLTGDDTPVVALLAEPAFLADARRFVYMIGLLDVAGIPVAGLVGPGTAHLSRARRFHVEAAVKWRLLLAPEPVAALAHACDLMVLVPPAPHRELSACERAWARWAILRAHLLGTPVVAGSEWMEGLCPEEARGLLDAEGASITDIGRRLARLVLAPDLRGRIAAAVRSHAERLATREGYARALRSHWGFEGAPAVAEAVR